MIQGVPEPASNALAGANRNPAFAGKVILAALILVTLATSLAVAGLTLLTRGPEYFVAPAVRLVLTVVLLACVFVGYKWAQWTAVVLFASGAVLGVALSVVLLVGTEPTPLQLAIPGGLTARNLLLAAALVIPNPVTSYLESTRE